MPTILGTRFPSTYTGYPPRMSPEDWTIWQRWWPGHQAEVQGLYFDVGLGFPDQLPTTDDANQLLGWIRNTQKRADVIIERKADVLLIELRHQAQMNALGRLVGYKKLLEQDNPFHKLIIPVLVTNKKDSEVQDLARDFDVVYEVV